MLLIMFHIQGTYIYIKISLDNLEFTIKLKTEFYL